MLTQRNVQSALLAAAMAAGIAAPALADTMLLRPVHDGGVTYITGGIGAAERHALDDAARNYNLRISNANRAGDFTTDTDLTIQTKNGHEMLHVAATGPLFYARLPAGDYIIRATNSGQQRVRDVTVASAKSTDLHLIWPQQG